MPAESLLTPELVALIGTPMWDAQTVGVREEDILRYQEALGDPMIVRDANGVLRAPPLFLPAIRRAQRWRAAVLCSCSHAASNRGRICRIGERIGSFQPS